MTATATKPAYATATEALKAHWGHAALRPEQADILAYLADGYDVIAVLPTSYGKSAIYQIPPLLDGGCTLVVSPLIALMKDQVGDCLKRGIPASYVNSHVAAREAARRFADWVAGKYRVFYVAPERIVNDAFRKALRAAPVTLVAIDEAHCQPPDTPVLMADGAYRRIDGVGVGDYVLSAAPDGRLVPGRVTHHRVAPVGRRRLLKVVTPRGSVTLTDNHRVFRKGDGYVEACDLRPGDTLLSVVPAATVRPSRRRGRGVLRGEVLGGRPAGRHTGPSRAAVRGVRDRVREAAEGASPAPAVLLAGLCGRGAGTDDRDGSLCRVWPRVHATGEPDPKATVLFCGVRAGGTGEGGPGGPDRPRAHARAAGQGRGGPQGRPGGTATSLVAVPADEDGVRVPPVPDVGAPGRLAPRPSDPADSAERRVRRAGTHPADTTLRGRAAGRHLEETRVDRVEVLEPGGDGRDGAGRYDYRRVHSITVEGEHNYFANGVQVGNCASTWGHDFRPAYQRVRDVLPLLDPRPPVLAVTATATGDIVEDVAQAVGLAPGHKRVVADPIRPNLAYRVVDGDRDPVRALADVFAAWRDRRAGGRYVVYVGTQRGCDEVAYAYQLFAGTAAARVGTPAAGVGVYHGGMNKGDRERAQDAFKSGAVPLIVATCAFGMGIDVPDIRGVCHAGVPGSLEDYTQETGRAGRDGLHSDVCLMFTRDSVRLRNFFIDLANPAYDVYAKVWAFLNKHLGPGEILTESDAGIGRRIKSSGDDVGAALSVMAAHGLVRRTPIPFGAVVEADVDRLRRVVLGRLLVSPAQRAVAVAAWRLHVAPDLPDPPPPAYAFGMSKAAVADACGLSRDAVEAAVAGLAAKGVWSAEAVDYGRTVRLLVEGRPLRAVLPPDVVAAKRDRDEARLDAMIAYAHLKPGQHAPFVRQYFLGPKAGKE